MTIGNRTKSPIYIPYAKGSMQVEKVSIAKIRENPNSARPLEGGKELKDLVESIKCRGLLNPVHVVRCNGYFELTSGGRRVAAHKILGLTSIGAIVHSPDEPPDIFLIDNLVRKDLDPIGEAYAIDRLIEDHGYTHQRIADRLGISRTQVTQRHGIIKISEDILQQAASIVPSLSRAKLIELSQIADEAGQRQAWQQIIDGGSRDDLRERKSKTGKKNNPTAYAKKLTRTIKLLQQIPDRLCITETDEVDERVHEHLPALKNAIAEISARIEAIEARLDSGHGTTS